MTRLKAWGKIVCGLLTIGTLGILELPALARPPTLPSVTPQDFIPVIPYANPTAQGFYATPGQITSGAFGGPGSATTVLHGNPDGSPNWGAVNLGTDVSGNLLVGSGGTGATTASGARANLGAAISGGTGTTLLHGNASGDGSYAPVNLNADVTGTLPAGNLPAASGSAAGICQYGTGSTNCAVGPRGTTWFDLVNDGGADPTGVANSTPACTAGVASGKSVIFVPAGTYDFKTACALTSGITIFAQPGTATIKADASNTGASGGKLFVVTNQQHVHVTGLILDGDYPTLTAVTTREVYVNGGDDVVVENSRFQNVSGASLVFSGATNPVTRSGARNNYFHNVGLGDYLLITNPALTDIQDTLIFSNGSATTNLNNFAVGNSFDSVGGDAISIGNQGQYIADSNRIYENLTGWVANSVNHGTYGIACIYITATTDAGITLSNNICQGATGSGFDIGASGRADVNVVGNTLIGNGGAGISVGAATLGVHVAGNYLFNNYQSNNGSFTYPNLAHQGAISISCGGSPPTPSCTANAAEISISGNIASDNQGTPTQPYGVWVQSGITVGSSVYISPDNSGTGNVTSLYGGLATPYAPSLSAPFSNFVLLTTGTSWTAPAGANVVEVDECGAGGGGGGVAAATATASGGLAGPLVTARMNVTPGTAYSYSIGAGGNGGAAGNNGGTAGGGTTFNGLAVHGGGAGGGSASGNAGALTNSFINGSLATSVTVPTSSVTVTGFTLLLNTAGSGSTGGAGVNSPWGAGGAGGANAAGSDATGYCAGGGGAGSSGSSSFAGGKGASGAIVLRW